MEVGISRGGPRFIMGDFNHDLDQLQGIQGWATLQAAGWKDAQDLACEKWGREHTMTYRDSSITDHILISPEMIPYVEEVCSWNADHAALGVRL